MKSLWPPSPSTVGVLRRIALRTGIVAVAFVVVYAIAAQILLGGGRLGRMLSHEPEKLRVQYASASSWWFGRGHVEGFDLRLRNDDIELEAHIDRADASVSLLGLLSHRFRTTRIDAHGVSFRMRLRREDGALPPEAAERLPPIDGFPALPIKGVPPLPPAQDADRPFTVMLDGLDLHEVREVWLDAFRLTGDLAVRGAFTIAPGDHFQVDPTQVEVRNATLATGADDLVEDVQGNLDARIARVPLTEITAAGILRRVSSSSRLEGKVGGISFLRHYLPPSLAPSAGAGVFRGKLDVDRGVITPRSTGHVEQGPLAVTVAPGYRASARATLDLTVDSDESGVTSRLALALADVTLSGTDGKPVATSDVVSLAASLEGADLATPPRGFHYAWEAPRSIVEDLRVVDATFGSESDFRIEWGRATVATSGSGSLQGLEARATIDSAATMQVEGGYLSSKVAAKVGMKADFQQTRQLDLSGSAVDLSDLTMGQGKRYPGWTSHVALREAVVHMAPPSVDLILDATARDGRPAIDLFAAMKNASAATRVALAVIPDAAVESATANLVGSCRLHAAPALLMLRGLDVRGASSRVRGDLIRRGDLETGAFLFETAPVTLGLGFDGKGAYPVLIGAADWFARVPR